MLENLLIKQEKPQVLKGLLNPRNKYLNGCKLV